MWTVLQIADSAFPTGGFAHSGGLEAACALGEVRSGEELARFVDAAIWQAGAGGLPLVRAAWDTPSRLVELDARCDAFLTGHVANRASRTQGRAFAATCASSFGVEVRGVHLAPVFGAVLRALEVGRDETMMLWLHLAMRGVISAAVRLGRIGPLEGQRIQRALAPRCDEVLAACRDLALDDLAVVAPIAEIAGTLHDRLYSRLFQS